MFRKGSGSGNQKTECRAPGVDLRRVVPLARAARRFCLTEVGVASWLNKGAADWMGGKPTRRPGGNEPPIGDPRHSVPPEEFTDTHLSHCERPMKVMNSHLEDVEGIVYRTRYWACRVCGLRSKTVDEASPAESC